MANDNTQWSSEQMIENASNWSLAGDVALLNSLKKFSETLLKDTESVSSKVDNLLNNLENVSLKLELTRNEFQSLRNTQFIENRVYEDDETLEHEESKEETKELTDEDKENTIKNAISKGLKVMEKYYDKVELNVSDSEGEGNETNYVLQPKDPYIDRPLPYLVGTQDWYKKWHVGLLPSDSESESEKEEDVYSSSGDSEEYLPKNRVLGSETSSELDFANRNTGPAANSTFNDSQSQRREIFHSSDESSEQSSSLSAKTPISSEKFAEQLAAKLGDVISGKSETAENVTKPTARINQPSKYGNLFFDEPPPMEDLDDTVLPKSAHKGLFSGGKDLFAENENDLFWDSQQSKTGASKEKMGAQKPTLHGQPPSNISKSKPFKDLFDESDSSSEEDMLTVTEKRKILSTAVSNPYMQAYRTTVPFVDDQPPEITPRNETGTKKKPVGGVSVFGNNPDIFAGKPANQKQQKSPVESAKKAGLFDESSDEDMFTSKARNPEKEKPSNAGESKKLSLFEESDDLTASKQPAVEGKKPQDMFENPDDLFPPKKEKPKSTGLFDEDTDMFKPTRKEIADKAQDIHKVPLEPKKTAKKISLFDDDDDFLKEEEDIFASVPKKNKGLFDNLEDKSHKKPSKGLFDDLEDSISDQKGDDSSLNRSSKEPSKGLFDDLSEAVAPSKSNDTSQISSVNKPSKSLFDDFDSPDNSDDGDLFSAPKQTTTGTVKKQEIVKVDAAPLFPKTHEGSAVIKNNKDEVANKGEDIKTSVTEDGNEDSPEEIEEAQKRIAGRRIFDDSGSSGDGGQENMKSKSDQTSETVLISSDVTHTQDNGSLPEKDVDIKDIKDNKKEILVKVKKNVGLFDSESEKSSDEDIFTSYGKKPDIKENQIISDDLFGSNKTHTAHDVTESVENIDRFEPKIQVEEKVSAGGEFVVPPPISLFDPTPPPVDWDATSDNSAESDTFSLTDGILDRTNYNQTQPTSSSLFDEAPPSLDVNDMNNSSAIVRDINVTRVETDDSSFNPHASSSRRLSSDIFNDQQSQDSFFVTKNPIDSVTAVSGLKKITENLEESTSEIDNLTPSGNPEDFEGSNSVFEANDDMDETTSVLGVKKPVVPPRVHRLGNIFEPKTDKDDVDKKPVVAPTKTSPGKLKHNLNINVGALLPGAGPPRNRLPIAKSVSLDETDKSTSTPAGEPRVLLPKPTFPLVRPKSEIFDTRTLAVDSSEAGNLGSVSETGVLQSVTKDRARIPVKRRPSTRKARQEAVRKSATDFSLYQDVEHSVISEVENLIEKTSEQGEHEKPNKTDDGTNKEILDIKTSEDVLEVKGVSLVFDKDVNQKQENVPKVEDLFNTPAEDIFKSSSKPIDVSQPKPDVFIPTPSSLLSEEDAKTEEKSLFDDVDDESFSIVKKTEVKSSSVVSTEDTTSVFAVTESTQVNTSNIVKTENTDLFHGLTKENEDIFAAGGTFLKKEEPKSLFEDSYEDSIFKTSTQSGPTKDAEPKSIFEPSKDDSEDIFETLEKSSTVSINVSKKGDDSKPDENISRKSKVEDIFETSYEDKDIFKTAQSTTLLSSEAKKKTSIFGAAGSPSDSDEDLFSSGSRLSKKKEVPAITKPVVIEERPSKLDIFSKSDSDSDGDFFGGKPSLVEKRKMTEPAKKTSLFDDGGSSEDDLFGSKTSKSSSAESSDVKDAVLATKRVEIKTASIKKLENKEVTDFDPLSGFK